MIGRFGSLRFNVSPSRILTFDDMQLTSGLKTAEHDVPGWKGRWEVSGEEMDEVTLHIILMASEGVRPRSQYQKIRMMMRNKEIQYLIIGKKAVMDRRCMITKISSEWKDILHKGDVPRIELDVTFKEYQ
jgi:phage protein U